MTQLSHPSLAPTTYHDETRAHVLVVDPAPFQVDLACPKCGKREYHYQYVPHGASIDVQGVRARARDRAIDWLLVSCATCSHTTAMRTLDASRA